MTLLSPHIAVHAQDQSQSAIKSQAQVLTQKGHQKLDQGQAHAALASWQQAQKLYRQAEYPEGITGSLINQSLALQELGHQINSCRTLLEALELEPWVCQSPRTGAELPENPEKLLTDALQQQPDQRVVAVGLQSLGDVLRLLGKPDESKVVLLQALSKATRLSLPETTAIQLSLANTERFLYERSQNQYQITEEPIANATALINAQTHFRETLKLYQQVSAARDNGQDQPALQAQLNQLRLLLDLNEWVKSTGKGVPPLQALLAETQPQIKPLVDQLLPAEFSQLPAQASIYARLNFANSLMTLQQSEVNQIVEKPLLVALQQSQEGLRLAEQIDNHRAKSSALGTMGNIYFQNKQTAIAQQQLEAALAQAQAVQAWDLAYQWQEGLGQLYEQAGQRDQAIAAFKAAVESLERVRANLVSVDADLQFSFKEKVEPVYRRYMRLLLATPNPDLEQVIRTNEQLQVAELENFLQCGKLDFVSSSELQKIPNPPAIIHILNLDDQIQVIVRAPDGSLHLHRPDSELVNQQFNNLQINLESDQFLDTPENVFLPYAQSLYQQLIAPIQNFLPKSGTLAFVVDSSFQSLPMALLHNGQDYLLKNYSVSVLPSSQLRQPKILEKDQFKVLIGGLSEKSPSFEAPEVPNNLPALPEVATEIAKVEENTNSDLSLINNDFTGQKLQRQINKSNFPIVHLTTHGQFSSDPEQTFILAWDKALNVRELDSLLRSNGNQPAIELLVLSACETSRGDRRSALGIAGVATQAGARSTVASLWRVEAGSTSLLVEAFYQELRRGLPKAEALRQAQVSLLANPETSHPFYWAPFILVGSWL